jgi:hypothetical protein
MAAKNSALLMVARVEQMPSFIEHPAMNKALDDTPVSMPHAVGSLGLDTPFWAGLGMVGLWAALDAFAERESLPKSKCPTCRAWGCIWHRYTDWAKKNNCRSQMPTTDLEELEDLRHLYGHNYAGDADSKYFSFVRGRRHILKQGSRRILTSGAEFDGRKLQIELNHLRAYAVTAKNVLRLFP